MTGFYLLVVFGTCTIAMLVPYFAHLPQFGASGRRSGRERAWRSQNHNGRVFVNPVPTFMKVHASKMIPVMYRFMFPDNEREPRKILPQENIDRSGFEVRGNGTTCLRWFGHSAVYLETEGKRLLLDPMFGRTASPFSLIGSKRFNRKLPFQFEDLPEIDAVLLTHDHYDHLDYHSIIKLKPLVNRFFVPLGVGAHLLKWGIGAEKITEVDWWDEIEFEGLKFISVPTRHFSGRSVRDRNRTLWNAWIIQGPDRRIFFNGDSGYFHGFKTIGEKFGPFDLCMVECGAYNENWREIHMFPEESAQAFLDLRGKVMMPIHWAAFSLSIHAWDEPVRRLTIAAKELGITLLTPKIGEEVVLDQYEPNEAWWLE